jgi:hypothetical protein
MQDWNEICPGPHPRFAEFEACRPALALCVIVSGLRNVGKWSSGRD